MSSGYLTLDQKPFLSHYLYTSAIVDHPVEKVWKRAIDLPSWMSANHEWEPIAGEPGKAGYFWRMWPPKHYVPDDLTPPLYHFAGLAKVIPHKLIALEVFMERGGSYGNLIPEDNRGFDDLLFTDLGDKTCVTALFIDSSHREPDQEHPEPLPDEETAKNVSGHLDNLKKVVDGVPLDEPASESFRPH